jgi:hypothetical protein
MASPDLATLARQVQRLCDIEEIKRLRHAYFRCLDTANVEELRGLLTDDYACRCIGGNYEYVAKGPEEFLGMIANSFHSEIVTQHNAHGPEIDVVDETRATGLWYFHDQVYNFRTRELLIGTGLYRDRYRKVDGRWKLEYGEYERVYELTEILPRPPHLTAHYLGAHGKKIPASARYDTASGRTVV